MVQPVADLPATPEVVDPIIIVNNPVDGAAALPPAGNPVIGDDDTVPVPVKPDPNLTPPRRPERIRRPPDRYTSDTHRSAQQRSVPGLEQRVSLLKSLLSLLLETGGSSDEQLV